MKRIFLLLMIGLLAAANGFAQQTADEKAIVALMQEQEAAWNRGDIKAFMQGYWKNDSLTFTGSSGLTYGWQNTYEGYLKRYDSPAKMGQLKFTIIQLKPLGKKYYSVVGKWYLTRSAGNVGGHFSLVLKKFKEGWRIIADHSS